MFDLYDGGLLDLVCVGAGQIDAKGNVNVASIGSRLLGVGGFVNLTLASREVIFLTTFTAKGMKTTYRDSRLHIVSEGSTKKFVNKLDQISFNGDIAVEDGRKVLYITERCVFQLTPKGLQLIEVAPGIDVRKDILAHMEFEPLVPENPRVMDKDFFRIH